MKIPALRKAAGTGRTTNATNKKIALRTSRPNNLDPECNNTTL
jgi:hypothetical protein